LNIFKAIQVKTTIKNLISLPNLKEYHVLALVFLEGENDSIFLEESSVFLLKKSDVVKNSYRINELLGNELSKERLEELFS